MALTYAAPLVGATAINAGLTKGSSLVAFYVTGEEKGRTYVPNATVAGGGTGSTNNATTGFPVVVNFIVGTDLSQPAVSGAGITIELQFPSANPDVSSPQTLYLDQQAVVGLVSGTF